MRYLFIFLLLLFSTFNAFSHVEPIASTDGKMILNQNFKGNFAMEFIFLQSQNVFFQDIGIEFFNVGDDDTSSIYFALYDKTTNTLVKYSDTTITSIYNQTVFVDFFVSLEGNKPYLLVFGSKNNLNDDQINYFQPTHLPYSNTIIPLSIQQIYHDNASLPQTITKEAPFLSFGIANQTGIDFIENQIIKKIKSDPKATEYHTFFKTKTTKLKLTSIGLTYLDVGPNLKAKFRLSIKNAITNHVLFSLDTTVVNIRGKKIDFPSSVELDTATSYAIGCENLDMSDTDNIILVYKPISLPYSDNLNYTQITAFYKNFVEDTLGVAFYMNYSLPKSVAGINKLPNVDCYDLIETNQWIKVDFKNGVTFEKNNLLFTLDGRNYSEFVSTSDSALVIDKSVLNTGIYLLNFHQNCRQSMKLLIAD